MLPSPALVIRRWGVEADKSQCIVYTEMESRNALLLFEVPLPSPLLLLLLSAINTSHIRVTRAAKHSSVDRWRHSKKAGFISGQQDDLIGDAFFCRRSDGPSVWSSIYSVQYS